MNADRESPEVRRHKDATAGTVLPYASKQEDRRTRVWQVGVMVVIAFILVALVVLIPSVPESRPRAIASLCRVYLQSIGMSLAVYEDEFHQGPADFQVLVDNRYVQGASSCRCPGYERRGFPGSGYYVVTGLREDDPPDWIVVYDDPANHPPQINVLYHNSTIKHLTAAQFEVEKKRFREAFRASRGHDPVILDPNVPVHECQPATSAPARGPS